RFVKVRLADDKILDIAGVEDVFLKTSFSTSWTLKDVRYNRALKRRLISVRQLDEEGYYIGFRDQQWIGMSMLAFKGNVPDVRKVDIYFCKPGGLGKQNNLSFIMSLKTRKLQSRSYGRYNANLQVKYLKFDNGLRTLEEEWRGKDTSLAHLKVFGCDSFVKVKDVCGEAMKCTFIGSGSDEVRYSFRDTKSHQVIRSRDIIFVDSIYEARSMTNSSSLTKPIQKSQVMLVDILENLAENDSRAWVEFRNHSRPRRSILRGGRLRDSIVTKIHQRVQGSSKMFMVKEEQDGSKRYKARLMVKDFQQKREVGYNEIFSLVVKMTTIRLVLSIVAARAFLCVRALNDTSTHHKSKGFQLAGQTENLKCRLKEILYGLIQAPRQWYLKFDSFMQRAGYKRCAMDHCSDMAKFNKPKWKFPLVFEMKDRCSKKHVLGYVLTVGVTTVKWESRLQKIITMFLIFVEDSWNEEPCSDVHQVGDEKEVEVLRSFNWPPSELIMEDGVLLERGYSQFNDSIPYVRRYRKVRAVALLKGRRFEVYRDYLRRRALK
ncbi:retrovirus-related pol polyprotein from transposon TNT 1-94, partial [Tanacetum coccineum]